MKTIRTIFTGVALTVISLGCSDFLEVTPQNQLTQSSFPSNEADALAATNAIYQILRESNYHRGFYPIDDIMSDDALKGSSQGDQSGNLGPFDTFDFAPTNIFIGNWWGALYQGIRRANVVINRVPGVEMDETLRQRYLGEAQFLRALYYSDLARGYGGVPLIVSDQPNLSAERSSLEEVYTLIEEDLLFAIDALPEKSDFGSSSLGRATRGAAKALLSRVYLYENRFEEAASLVDEIVASGQYDLEPVYFNAFRTDFEHGVESVFEIGGIGVEGTSGGGNEYVAGQGVRGTPNQGFGFNRPSLDLINSFEPNDPRMQATVIFLGEVIDGIEILGDPGTPDITSDGQPETYNQKTWTGSVIPAGSRAHNRRLIRYSEVLLNGAEAHAEAGNITQSLAYLEMVRARAREGNTTILPEITATNPPVLLDLIFEERRHELAMEGFRFWDLVRSGRAPDILGPLGYQSNRNELLPIPQSEIDISEGRIIQNVGW
ncbi:MAG: RagB/SusD family nutrient uptake outer membrane protein [Cytophagales bacterium]|nr:RagB/SusD family nutrient uptake outer membrane protein [Cytophagales bacterium]